MTGQYREFAFTIFHDRYPTWSPDMIDRSKVNYFVGQEEICPDTGKRHWQCAAQVLKRCGFGKFEAAIGLPRENPKKPSFHCERVWSDLAKCSAYCSKEDSRMPQGQQVAFGEITHPKSIWDYVRRDAEKGVNLRDLKTRYPEVCVKYPTGLAALYEAAKPKYVGDAPETWHKWQENLIEAFMKPCEDKRTIHWFWDQKGGSGKTTLAQWLHDHLGAFLCTNAKSADIAYAWDDHPIAVFDFARCTQDGINWGVIENLKNGFIFSPKYQSTAKRFPSPHVICFANFPPTEGKMSADRWNIVNLAYEPTTPQVSAVASEPLPTLSDADIDQILSEVFTADADVLVPEGDNPSSDDEAEEPAAHCGFPWGWPGIADAHTPTGSGNNESDPPKTPSVSKGNARKKSKSSQRTLRRSMLREAGQWTAKGFVPYSAPLLAHLSGIQPRTRENIIAAIRDNCKIDVT